MNLSSYQGEYKRVIKHLKALEHSRTFVDFGKASRFSLQISELRRVKRVLEFLCSCGGMNWAPEPPPLNWKPSIVSARRDAPAHHAFFGWAMALFSRMFSRGLK